VIQSVLFKSPYSGCAQFSGWPKAPCGALPPSAYWPAQNARGSTMCVDRGRKPSGAAQSLQRVHFRPALPYPGVILGPGLEGLRPMPRVIRPPRAPVAYNLHAISGPSATGPYTYAIARGINPGGGLQFVSRGASGPGGGSGLT
jgi:hypothetical protein